MLARLVFISSLIVLTPLASLAEDATALCQKLYSKELQAAWNQQLPRILADASAQVIFDAYSNAKIAIQLSDIVTTGVDFKTDMVIAQMVSARGHTTHFLTTFAIYGTTISIDGSDDGVYDAIGNLVAPPTKLICNASISMAEAGTLINADTGRSLPSVTLNPAPPKVTLEFPY